MRLWRFRDARLGRVAGLSQVSEITVVGARKTVLFVTPDGGIMCANPDDEEEEYGGGRRRRRTRKSRKGRKGRKSRKKRRKSKKSRRRRKSPKRRRRRRTRKGGEHVNVMTEADAGKRRAEIKRRVGVRKAAHSN